MIQEVAIVGAALIVHLAGTMPAWRVEVTERIELDRHERVSSIVLVNCTALFP